MIESYPLYWPEGRPRTKQRTYARFDTSMGVARDKLMHELRLLGAKELIISTNMPIRRDGLPYASAREPGDPGVAVYFKYKGKQHCFACDRWDSIKDNMQAINLTISALRGVARWGTGDMMEQAFRGFEALPAPMAMRESWAEILGVKAHASTEEIKQAYIAKAKQYHPDRGGSNEEMNKINSAWETVRQERGL